MHLCAYLSSTEIIAGNGNQTCKTCPRYAECVRLSGRISAPGRTLCSVRIFLPQTDPGPRKQSDLFAETRKTRMRRVKFPLLSTKFHLSTAKNFSSGPRKGQKIPPSAAAVRNGRGGNGGVSSIYNVKSLRHGLEKAGTFSACLPSGKRSAPSGHAGGRRLFTSQQGNRRGSRRTAAVRRIRSVRIPPSGGN